MYLERSITIQQKQTLAISSKLIQSLKILQFRHDELHAFLTDQAERNPLIEVSLPPAPVVRAAPPAATSRDRMRPVPSLPSGGFARHAGDLQDIAQTLGSAAKTLREHLHEQIPFALDDMGDRAIAFGLADNLDPDGYLRGDLDLLADTLCTDLPRLERVLARLQTLDPVGIGARDLAECLRLQLAARDQLCARMATLLDNIALLGRFDIDRLATLLKTDTGTVLDLIRVIRTLDPKPGHRFDAEPVMPALPDVLVRDADGERMRVELNAELLPRVLIDRQYYSDVISRTGSAPEKRFVTDCMANANFLIKCLDQRASTLLKVATEIASRQRACLRLGPEHLAPLSLKDVAQATGFHESTVCRSIANKYMMTAHGMVELKAFFSNALPSRDGRPDPSTETVRHQIRRLVDAETPARVLRDEDIVAELKGLGIEVARRTVAKYRDMMRIPSSSQRRRQMQAGCPRKLA